jgi:flagellar assembly protein FliH
MRQAPAVLRQPLVGDVAILPARGRTAQASAIDALAVALEEAREEGMRQGRERGMQAGYEAGLREGREAAQQEAREHATRVEEQAVLLREERRAEIQAAVAAFGEATSRWLALAEEDLVALCLETLGRILGDGSHRREQVRAQVVHLVEQWQATGAPVLHLHPADVDLLQGLPTSRPFTSVADPEVRHGGCIVSGPGGALDARLDRIFEQIKSALLAARASGGSA